MIQTLFESLVAHDYLLRCINRAYNTIFSTLNCMVLVVESLRTHENAEWIEICLIWCIMYCGGYFPPANVNVNIIHRILTEKICMHWHWHWLFIVYNESETYVNLPSCS